MRPLCAIIIICSFCVPQIRCFVYDPENVHVFNSSGYFGYSVYIEYLDSKRFQLLSAAPKDNTVRSCTLLNGCDKLDIPQAVIPQSKINFMGATITGPGVANRSTLICNPQYADQIRYFTNGICFIKGRTFKTYSPLSHSSRQFRRYNGSYEYLYAHGQLGFSVKHIENEGFLLGAPGVLNWRGTVLKYTFDEDDKELNPETKIERLSYLGYSLEFGHFMFRGKSVACVVVGAPKGDLLRGEVHIFSYVYFPNLELKIFKGSQFGAYFGHSLLVSSGDLLVGAPMQTAKLYEEGCVYVMSGASVLMRHNRLNMRQSQMICGPKPGGRFGFAMAHITRPSTDLFNMVVISAPYEDENSGSVYLYTRIDDFYELVQQIKGKSIFPSIRGFGYSLSNSLDVDRNLYPDFAIGAYLSSSVVIFKSRPILKFTGRLTSNVSHIQDDVQFIGLDYCFRYNGLSNSNLTVTIELNSDDRVDIQQNNFLLTSQINQDQCTPITMRLRSQAHFNPYPLSIKILNKLQVCPSCPIAYPNDTFMEIEIASATGCGTDAVCTPELLLSNSLAELSSFVVGSQPSLRFIVEVRNAGETAYRCKLNISLTADVDRIPPACSRHEEVIICDVSSRFGNQQKKSFQFDLDMQNYHNYTSSVNGTITAFSVGEGNGKMITQIINLPLVFNSNLTVIGHSSPEYLMYNQERDFYLIHHEYLIFNNGPSPLINWQMVVLIPQNVSNLNGGFEQVFEITNNVEGFCVDEGNIQVSSKSKRNIKEIDANVTEYGRKFSLDCNGNNKITQCKRYVCDVGILANQSLKLDFLVVGNLNFLMKTYQDIIQENALILFESSKHHNETISKIHTVLYGSMIKKPIAIWIWIISVILAILILALITYGLYKIKFFKRRDMQTLVNEDEASQGILEE